MSSGSYGNLTLTNVTKSADVTIVPAGSASASVGSMNLQHVTHLHFTGGSGSLSVGGGVIDQFDTRPNCSSNLTFDYLRFTSALDILPRCAAMAIKVDHANLNNVGPGGAGEGKINVQALDLGPSSDQGITISNSTFDGGCSKGIQILGGAYGTQVLNNEFAHMPDQSTCDSTTGVHIGGVQLYGAPFSHLKGNYFFDNGTSAGGVSMLDPGSHNSLVEDNVFVCSCVYPWSIQAGAQLNDSFLHNTFAGGGGLHFYFNVGANPSGNLVRDNVFTDAGNGITDSSGANWGTHDHNLNSGLSGTGEITGTPVFVGGGSTSAYANWYLVPGSPGAGAASDGGDMGIR